MKTLEQLTAERGGVPPAVIDAQELFNTFNSFVRTINRAKGGADKQNAIEAFHLWFANRGIFVDRVNWF